MITITASHQIELGQVVRTNEGSIKVIGLVKKFPGYVPDGKTFTWFEYEVEKER